MPTPAVAWLVRDRGADLGAVISASHNPYPDNGIKFFGGDGFKLTDAEEHRVEALLSEAFDPPTGYGVGTSEVLSDGAEQYVAYVASVVDRDLSGLRVAVDCANGAASGLAGQLLERLGVRHDLIGAATERRQHQRPRRLDPPRARRREGARPAATTSGSPSTATPTGCCASMPTGAPSTATTSSPSWRATCFQRDTLPGSRVVLTSMANLGLQRALETMGCSTIVTDVGDRYVLEAMRRDGAELGGEQSGHVIALAHSTTGDGLLTAALLLAALAHAGEGLADAARLVTKFPQRLVSVRADRTRLRDAEAVWEVVREVEGRVGATRVRAVAHLEHAAQRAREAEPAGDHIG